VIPDILVPLLAVGIAELGDKSQLSIMLLSSCFGILQLEYVEEATTAFQRSTARLSERQVRARAG